MKTYRWMLLLITGIAVLLCACREDRASAEQWSDPKDSIIKLEREQRVRAEARAEGQEKAKSIWQGIAAVSLIIAGVLLLVGAAIGSSAKHESSK